MVFSGRSEPYTGDLQSETPCLGESVSKRLDRLVEEFVQGVLTRGYVYCSVKGSTRKRVDPSMESIGASIEETVPGLKEQVKRWPFRVLSKFFPARFTYYCGPGCSSNGWQMPACWVFGPLQLACIPDTCGLLEQYRLVFIGAEALRRVGSKLVAASLQWPHWACSQQWLAALCNGVRAEMSTGHIFTSVVTRDDEKGAT